MNLLISYFTRKEVMPRLFIENDQLNFTYVYFTTFFVRIKNK